MSKAPRADLQLLREPVATATNTLAVLQSVLPLSGGHLHLTDKLRGGRQIGQREYSSLRAYLFELLAEQQAASASVDSTPIGAAVL